MRCRSVRLHFPYLGPRARLCVGGRVCVTEAEAWTSPYPSLYPFERVLDEGVAAAGMGIGILGQY